MDKKEKNVIMPGGLNTASCWVVKSPFSIRMKNNAVFRVSDGFAKQTPALCDKNEIKISSNGAEFVLHGENVIEVVDDTGNAFWI